jgi:hypothetical protein
MWRFVTTLLFICKTGFLDFVHRLRLNKSTAFRKLDCLLSSGKKEKNKLQLLGHLVELVSDLVRGSDLFLM